MGALSTAAPRLNLDARWLWAGEDLLILVTGGQRPHLGAVAMAAPRPSLADPGAVSATTTVFCYPGHKEDELAKALAQRLASALNVKVTVAAGAHWDGLSGEDIAQVRANALDLGELLLAALRAERPDDQEPV
jgi:hypothetical protein